MTIETLATKHEVAERTAELLCEQALLAQSTHGTFTIALSGGSTPVALHKLLTADPWRSRLPWANIQWLFGDERHVPPDHPDSNFRMATETLFEPGQVPADHQHPMIKPGDIDTRTPQQIAANYESTVKQIVTARTPQNLPQIDLILLGMGDDGHTASLFPHTAALHEHEKLVAANWVEKLNTWRITMARPLIAAAAQKIVLVTGADKAPALASVLEGELDQELYPAQMLREMQNVTWLVDHAAASKL